MSNTIKGAMVLGLVALGFNLSGCSNNTTSAAAEKSPDPAELTAAAIDQAAPAPAEKAPDAAKAAAK